MRIHPPQPEFFSCRVNLEHLVRATMNVFMPRIVSVGQCRI